LGGPRRGPGQAAGGLDTQDVAQVIKRALFGVAVVLPLLVIPKHAQNLRLAKLGRVVSHLVLGACFGLRRSSLAPHVRPHRPKPLGLWNLVVVVIVNVHVPEVVRGHDNVLVASVRLFRRRRLFARRCLLAALAAALGLCLGRGLRDPSSSPVRACRGDDVGQQRQEGQQQHQRQQKQQKKSQCACAFSVTLAFDDEALDCLGALSSSIMSRSASRSAILPAAFGLLLSRGIRPPERFPLVVDAAGFPSEGAPDRDPRPLIVDRCSRPHCSALSRIFVIHGCGQECGKRQQCGGEDPWKRRACQRSKFEKFDQKLSLARARSTR